MFYYSVFEFCYWPAKFYYSVFEFCYWPAKGEIYSAEKHRNALAEYNRYVVSNNRRTQFWNNAGR